MSEIRLYRLQLTLRQIVSAHGVHAVNSGLHGGSVAGEGLTQVNSVIRVVARVPVVFVVGDAGVKKKSPVRGPLIFRNME